MRLINGLLLFVLLGLLACKPDLEEFEIATGEADFSHYVAVGNSLTAGYMDGGLNRSGQESSFPNILARQFQKAGGGTFLQPLMVDDLGLGFDGILPVTCRHLDYITNCQGDIQLVPCVSGEVNPENFIPIGGQGPFNNLGVPGAKSFHLTWPGYGLLNPYYQRFAANVTSSSVIQDAALQNPSFFTLWIGANDVLTYALSGGTTDSITALAVFSAALQASVQSLLADGARGVIGNLPDVLDIPFFTTVSEGLPYNGLVLSDPQQLEAINAAYAGLFQFQLGPNAFVISDPAQATGLRQMEPGDLFLLNLPTDSILCAGWGSSKPIPSAYILDLDQQQAVQTAIEGYNEVIYSLAANHKRLVMVDFNTRFKTLQSGVSFDGIQFSTQFVNGGFFSLDGIHPNPRGNAVIANDIIEAINRAFGAQIPLVDITRFKGIQFP